MTWRKCFSLAIVLLLTLSFLSATTRVSAVEYPAIHVDPATTEDPALTPGTTYTVAIKTDYGTLEEDDIYGWEFSMTFDPTVLNAVEVVNGDLITNDTAPAYFIPPTIDNNEGTISPTTAFFMYDFTNEIYPTTSGPGTLAYVTFTVVGVGTSNITLVGEDTMLHGFDGTDTYLIIDGSVEPDHLGHGYFDNTALEVNEPPVAVIQAPTTALVGESVTFDGTGSYDPDGTIVSYSWDFGDGTTAEGATVTHTYAAEGTYTVTLTVTDDLGATGSATHTIEITAAVEGADVAVTNVVPATTEAYPTWIVPLDINVTVSNVGGVTATFTVTAYYDENVIGTSTVTELTPGATEELTFNWDLSGVPYGLYDIKAVATFADDVYLDNNERVVYDAVKVKLPGDVDGDGSVGGGDLGALGWAWGTTVGMLKYDQECDFDNDGSIGGGDLGTLGWNWGKSVTY